MSDSTATPSDPAEGRRRNLIGTWAFGFALAALVAGLGGQLTLTLNLSAIAIFAGFVGFFEGQRRGLRRLLSILAMAIGLVTLTLMATPTPFA
ncbi:hypothetical protein EYE40_10030 [Glaciihabitans arcticus]|uniref:Uncharacterized protein n=1 Tax=Glaciihabitans arcticus TaxID=2668039 RepID=A0A4Q9GVS7_9MICO|nr:hypothetical protein [Glaciihabitans arcticus]TBN57698.1 hypothetical protein EYE40_10030 [Glaciihabitans arcticus]